MESISTIIEKKHGGARTGAGKKKGTKLPKTLERLKVQEAFAQRVFNASGKLFAAQYQVATGLHFVYRIDEIEVGKGKTISKHVLVTDPKEIENALNSIESGDDEYYYVMTKEPDAKAVNMLLDRGLGTATESLEIGNKDGAPLIIKLD